MDYSTFGALIVEDDPEIARLVQRCLNEIPLSAVVAGTNHAAREMLEESSYDIVILDLGLPDGDGLSLARDLSANEEVGVIILTGRGEVTDKVIGLELGADDYVTKPFERQELNARIKSLVRRIGAIKDKPKTVNVNDRIVRCSGWTLDKDEMRLTHADGRAQNISASEFQLLEMFIERAGRLMSRDQIMDYLFETATPAFDRSIDVRVSRLRSKLELDPKHPTIISTVRNMGYVFRGRLGE